MVFNRVAEPQIGKEYFQITKDGKSLIPCKVIDGALFRNGRISNVWDWANLLTGEKEFGYGGFFELCKGDNEMNNQQAIDEMKINKDTIETIISYNAKCEPESDNSRNQERVEAIKLAIAALEKQIPKKPIHDGLYACPNCHTIMLQGAFEARGKCCKECGQALDWGEI